jgi:integrase
MDKLPYIPRVRNNYNFFDKTEIQQIASALTDNDNELSLLDKAITSLAYSYGLRGSDIRSLTMDNIDFENDTINIVQSKTKVPLTLPLSTLVGNAIFDYITKERPQSQSKAIFVHKAHTHHAFESIWYHIRLVCNEANVRVESGQVGCRIFRHHLATYLLSKDVSQPIISSILGHLLPESINHYIDSDIEHLRELALDISNYPVNPQLLKLWSVYSLQD